MKPALVKTDSPAIDAGKLLAVVGAVTREARPSGALQEITLDSSLERDLGLDSLARVELVLRLEREFSTSLPEQIQPDARPIEKRSKASKGGGYFLSWFCAVLKTSRVRRGVHAAIWKPARMYGSSQA